MDPYDLDIVFAQERELQTPECRSDPRRLDMLLADDFAEIGASGRIWTKFDILAHLPRESAEPRIDLYDLTARAVTDDTVLVHWESRRGGRVAVRSSLWRREDGDWRLVHHQGTLIA